MCLILVKNVFGQNTFFLLMRVSRKSRSWMVLFWSLLDQFISSFDFANGLSIFQFDALWFIHFLAKDFDRWVQWIKDSCFVFNYWKSKIKIYDNFILESMLLLHRFWVVKRVAWSQAILSFLAWCQILPITLLFFRDSFWRSGLLEYWIW